MISFWRKSLKMLPAILPLMKGKPSMFLSDKFNEGVRVESMLIIF